MSDKAINITPSDIVGAIQRQLQELLVYLNQSALQIDTNACLAHLDRTEEFLRSLQDAQLKLAAAQNTQGAVKGNGKEARN